MNAKPKTPPKKKAVRNAPSKKTVPAPKKKAITVQKTMAVPEKVKKPVQTRQSRAVSKVPVKKAGRKTGVRAKAKGAGRLLTKKPVVKKKVPLKKYHVNNKDWNKVTVMRVICSKMANSAYGLAFICRKNNDLPSSTSIYEWLEDEIKNGGATLLSDMYARAKEAQADYMADEIMEVADDGSNDFYEIEGVQKPDNENIQRSRLRVDARKWVAAKLKPRKYGDKLELTGDPERPLSALSDTELDAQIAALTKMLAEVKLA